MDSNRNITISDGSAIDQSERDRLPDYNSRARRADQRSRAASWQTFAVCAIVIVLLLSCVGGWTWQEIDRVRYEMPGLILFVRLLLFVGLPLTMMVALLTWARVELSKRSIIRLENDHPVTVQQVAAGVLPAADSLRMHYSNLDRWADNSQWRSLNQLSNSPIGGALADVAPQAPALPDSAPSLVSDSDWLDWISQQPHLMIAGKTGDGKTTMCNALLGRCIDDGDEIVVIDPKSQPGKWRGIPPLAGSLDYDDLYAALDTIKDELVSRYQEFNQGRPGDSFPRLRVVIDELPVILLGAKVGDRVVDKARFQKWLTFGTMLGSIAREVNINVWLCTQSPLVKDIYLSSMMLDNFSRLVLTSQVRDLLNEQRDPKKTAAMMALVHGERYQAAMEYRGDYYMLDTASVPQMARADVRRPKVWQAPAAPVLPAQQPPEPRTDRERWQQRAELQRVVIQEWPREKRIAAARVFLSKGWPQWAVATACVLSDESVGEEAKRAFAVRTNGTNGVHH